MKTSTVAFLAVLSLVGCGAPDGFIDTEGGGAAPARQLGAGGAGGFDPVTAVGSSGAGGDAGHVDSGESVTSSSSSAASSSSSVAGSSSSSSSSVGSSSSTGGGNPAHCTGQDSPYAPGEPYQETTTGCGSNPLAYVCAAGCNLCRAVKWVSNVCVGCPCAACGADMPVCYPDGDLAWCLAPDPCATGG